MHRVEQQKLHNPPYQNGDCMRATWASILECDIDDLPAWEEHCLSVWWYYHIAWLNIRGWALIPYGKPPAPDDTPFDCFLASGPSPRFEGVNHAVVYDWDGLVWDPHPDDTGLAGEPERYEWLVPTTFEVESSGFIWGPATNGTVRTAPQEP